MSIVPRSKRAVNSSAHPKQTEKPQPQPEIDRQRLAQAITAALRILRADPTITATVTKRGEVAK